jgi:DNA primase
MGDGPLIPDAIIQEIRERVDVVAVIGRHMELKRSGRTWRGNCVFHGEKTPSFHVYPEDKHFKCYGCGAYGDVFGFLQKLEGKEFPEVVRALAAEVGVEIPEGAEDDSAEARGRRKERNEVLAASDAAARYFAARLQSRHGATARAYLDRRGVSEESRARFRLGVSAPGWNDLPARLKEKGLALDALRKAGLVIDRERGEGTYDRFRNRLMFPIAGMDGQVIGFGGRVLPEVEQAEKGAKYLNTPKTALYEKSRVLYGLDLAREAIRKTRIAVLVEGYFDVIGLHQVGLTNAVAVCGTALTPEHVELLGRCDCREVVILFDGDSAGLAAPAKAASALFPAGLSGRVAVLPAEGGKVDPDDYARAHGRPGVEALLAAATPLSEFLIDRAAARSCGTTPREAPLEGKLAAVRELEPYARMMPEGLARSVFEDAISRRLNLDPTALKAELAAGPRSGPGAHPYARPAPPPPPLAPAGQPAPDASQRRPLRMAPRPPARLQILRPGPAVDALGLLVAFPHLGPAAEEEGLVTLLPAGLLADLARDCIQAAATTEQALARLREGADLAIVSAVEVWVGPGRPKPEDAEREFRRAVVKAFMERLDTQYVETLKLVTKHGKAGVSEHSATCIRLKNQIHDLAARLSTLERRG